MVSPQCRSLFEKAARAHYEASGEVAGESIGEAQLALYRCKGMEVASLDALGECERWFSFFGLWYSARLLEQGRAGEAREILVDQAESYNPERSVVLGIAADYGVEQTAELHRGTMRALELIQAENLLDATRQADEVADIQYRLAVEKCGWPPDGV